MTDRKDTEPLVESSAREAEDRVRRVSQWEYEDGDFGAMTSKDLRAVLAELDRARADILMMNARSLSKPGARLLPVAGCQTCPVSYCTEDGTFCAYESRIGRLEYEEGKPLEYLSEEKPELHWPMPPPDWCPLREGDITLTIAADKKPKP